MDTDPSGPSEAEIAAEAAPYQTDLRGDFLKSIGLGDTLTAPQYTSEFVDGQEIKTPIYPDLRQVSADVLGYIPGLLDSIGRLGAYGGRYLEEQYNTAAGTPLRVSTWDIMKYNSGGHPGEQLFSDLANVGLTVAGLYEPGGPALRTQYERVASSRPRFAPDYGVAPAWVEPAAREVGIEPLEKSRLAEDTSIDIKEYKDNIYQARENLKLRSIKTALTDATEQVRGAIGKYRDNIGLTEQINQEAAILENSAQLNLQEAKKLRAIMANEYGWANAVTDYAQATGDRLQHFSDRGIHIQGAMQRPWNPDWNTLNYRLPSGRVVSGLDASILEEHKVFNEAHGYEPVDYTNFNAGHYDNSVWTNVGDWWNEHVFDTGNDYAQHEYAAKMSEYHRTVEEIGDLRRLTRLEGQTPEELKKTLAAIQERVGRLEKIDFGGTPQ